MFFMEYVIPIIRTFFAFGYAIIVAIPFRICWGALAPRYLSFLPEVYQSIPYWHLVGLFIIIAIIGDQISRLAPNFVKVDQSNTNNSGK